MLYILLQICLPNYCFYKPAYLQHNQLGPLRFRDICSLEMMAYCYVKELEGSRVLVIICTIFDNFNKNKFDCLGVC